MNSFFGCVHAIAGVLCIVQLAAWLHSTAELRRVTAASKELVLTVCCCVAIVQKTIQAITKCTFH